MTTFRAAQVTSPRGPLALVDRRLTDPAPGTVRVAVEACGICHSDSVLVDDILPGLRFPVTRSLDASTRLARACWVGARVNVWRSGGQAPIAGGAAAVGVATSCTAKSAW